ncbi:hypothetical protein KC968_00080 [Candidatus Saccharibacteria bacterium]|nr:hypothetical protein [Candidatus Saccharibacteria bacterium]
MFGHDNNQQAKDNDEAATIQPTVAEPATDMQGFTPPPADPAVINADDTTSSNDTSSESVTETESTDSDITPSTTLDVSAESALELPESPTLPGGLSLSEPSADESAAPEPATTAPTPELYEETDTNTEDTASVTGDISTPVSGDLIDLKQEALQSLSPLVEKLDQTPEERFRTTMMMIQATDDSSKIRTAYEAAQSIEDEKIRAQALLDVVNEINYFTQQQKTEDAE